MSTDVTPLAQHLSCTWPMLPQYSMQIQMRPLASTRYRLLDIKAPRTFLLDTFVYASVPS